MSCFSFSASQPSAPLIQPSLDYGINNRYSNGYPSGYSNAYPSGYSNAYPIDYPNGYPNGYSDVAVDNNYLSYNYNNNDNNYLSYNNNNNYATAIESVPILDISAQQQQGLLSIQPGCQFNKTNKICRAFFFSKMSTIIIDIHCRFFENVERPVYQSKQQIIVKCLWIGCLIVFSNQNTQTNITVACTDIHVYIYIYIYSGASNSGLR